MTVILAIVATVACARFSELLQRQHVAQCRALIANDVLALRRYAQAAATTLEVSIPSSQPVLQVKPSCPLAPEGSISFSEHSRHVQFAHVDFDGSTELRILPSGTLVRSSDDSLLTRAEITIAADGYAVVLDLLAN